MTYDSRLDTYEHITTVRTHLMEVIHDLHRRSFDHDRSKLKEPEKSMFDEFTPKLRKLTYGSEEYKKCLQDMGEALQHHYDVNDHHPEHFADGVRGMNLIQVTEMLCDWKAASMRVESGDLLSSIRYNAQRFQLGGELEAMLVRTADYLGWV